MLLLPAAARGPRSLLVLCRFAGGRLSCAAVAARAGGALRAVSVHDCWRVARTRGRRRLFRRGHRLSSERLEQRAQEPKNHLDPPTPPTPRAARPNRLYSVWCQPGEPPRLPSMRAPRASPTLVISLVTVLRPLRVDATSGSIRYSTYAQRLALVDVALNAYNFVGGLDERARRCRGRLPEARIDGAIGADTAV